jgi:hypothetical protein
LEATSHHLDAIQRDDLGDISIHVPLPVPGHVLDRRPAARPHLVEQLSDEPEGVDLIVVLAGGEAQQLAAQRGVPR